MATDPNTGRKYEIICTVFNASVDGPGLMQVSRQELRTSEGYPVELGDGDAVLIHRESDTIVAYVD